MTTIVNDSGFSADDWTGGFVEWNGVDATAIGPGTALDVPNTLDANELTAFFGNIKLIRIPFPSHVDGRGFTVARRLRLCGFKGRLRACGHILADQYPMVRRCGFDEVEIDDEIARRQPQDQWQLYAEWQSGDYQAKLRSPNSIKKQDSLNT